jgi:hypothetical protein
VPAPQWARGACGVSSRFPLVSSAAVLQILSAATGNTKTIRRETAMPEAAPVARLSSDELLAEVRTMLLKREGAVDADAVVRSARGLCSAFRALDSRLSADGEWPTAWGGDGWTVIGVWQGDTPVPVGVLRGSHTIDGGDEYDVFPESTTCGSCRVSARTTGSTRSRTCAPSARTATPCCTPNARPPPRGPKAPDADPPRLA